MTNLWDSVEKFAHGVLTDADAIWHTDIVPFIKNFFSSVLKADIAAVDPIINATFTDLGAALATAAESGSAHGLVNTITGIALEATKTAEATLEGTTLQTGLAILASTIAKAANHPAVVAAIAAQQAAAAAPANPPTAQTAVTEQEPIVGQVVTASGLGAASTPVAE